MDRVANESTGTEALVSTSDFPNNNNVNNKERNSGGGMGRTLVVARGDEDGAGVVSDEALCDAGAAEVRGALFEDGAGLDDAGGEGVAVRLGAQLVDGGEDGLAQGLGGSGGRGRGGCRGAANVAGAGGRGPAVVGAPRGRRHRRSSLPAKTLAAVAAGGGGGVAWCGGIRGSWWWRPMREDKSSWATARWGYIDGKRRQKRRNDACQGGLGPNALLGGLGFFLCACAFHTRPRARCCTSLAASSSSSTPHTQRKELNSRRRRRVGSFWL